ncbi:Down syndrome cell adhesion molecule-like protein Dscam2 isoform X29 [Penaeus chinensis]|uniref:Down syndrome cell adhesion molecule-like protein Dscam2 isoform X29 n=1 Tax=Penaeus chinensis TaxID=139456 RepID=UPI001FB71C72|nr:Down syndrome cell adhesion molecule-like protein Dscam2 isoform X29 [Penaeus chinensis]XP_047472732.1 Down syndrome cell adhesion molecule-like protein Dscam2 isoform X29 [Penaeus chinensis]XP_047472733.1 Down syndrome cell adhesion molecule-like protein Dscam2 isoform X29 [Penaeus chinensis]XP_047472734.1 Down syndrome cell adhesion molecule-like protein Dscam2 isoform X29 [Penaeus chinensis]XP_047472735.1 Down syndrome cell adhesion molecule-like protein Dscam2 isoform X29 [Penaeus chinen
MPHRAPPHPGNPPLRHRRTSCDLRAVLQRGSQGPRGREDCQLNAGFRKLLRSPCKGQGFPVPEFRWFKVPEGGRKAAVELGERVKQVGGTLIIREAKVEDSGKYLCVVNNSVGGESVETVLTVTAPLSAQVEPKVQTVEFGRPATFTCTYRGNPVKSVTWLKDGIPLNHKEAVLRIDTVGREDKGMYQCFVRNDQESAQGTAELKLGGRFEPPQLIYTFQTNTLQPGPAVFLKCVAAGNPTPEITWELDGTRLANSERMQVGQYVTVNGEVVSHLNISAVHTNDGGLYACVASSTVGSVRHAARLNVYGLPYIRPMDKAAVVAGENMVVHCPVAGYPIDSIVWEKNGRMLPINRRQKTFPNGTLIVEAVQRSTDQGRYTCVARNSQAYTARGDLDVQVMEPPQIHPLVVAGIPVIGKELLIPCYVVGGDSPLDMVWQKDGQPISPARLDSNPPDPWHSPGDRQERSQTLEESCELLTSAHNESELGGGDELNMFSTNIGMDPRLAVHQRGDRYLVLRFSALCPHHSGNYTCEASNMAGTVGYTVPLDVLVPPRWIVEPADKAFALGSDARLECKADGFPRPSLGWKKAAGHTPGDYRDLDVNNPNIKVTGDGTLHISSIQKSHEGYYLCEANNGIGAGLSTVIYVRVQAPPQFKIQYRNQTARHGDDAVLECEAGGETPIGILWSKDKHSVDQAAEPRYTIREEMRGGSVHSSLSIKTTDRTDSAVYTCVATNAFGSADTNINLIIQEHPEQPSSLKVLDKSGRSVELSWTSPYDGNSPITRYIVEYKLSRRNWENDGERMMVPGNQNMAAVLDLRPATTYHLRIVARNEIGDSDPSDIVTIITAEEAPSGSPRDLKVEAVDQTSLRVKWKPPLREEWNGDIQGYQVGYRLASSNTSYVYETVEFSKEVGKEHQLTIKKLQVYTEYAVVVSAFNKIGQGPTTEEIRSYTAEGTPQQPPHDVTCTTLTSQTIRVSWASPPLETVQGVIKGYKVIYGPSDKWYDEERKDTKITSSTETHLHGLQKYTNYSLQVLAFTSGGEGVRSQPIHCQTDQDVPDAPTSVKALVMSADSILVSWLPPDRPNGIITQYTVYFKEEGKSDSEAEQEKLLSSQLNYEANGLKQRDEYVFWVTASTTIGEGEKSESVHLKLSSKVPAKIASFDDEYVATYKEDVKLHCQAVGLPTPDIRWTIRGEPFTPNDRMRLLTEGSLLIREVSRDDAGEYTCHVENPYGQDTVTHTLLIQAPPHPPEIQLQSTTTNSIEVKLKPSVIDDTTPIHGYTVYYKPEFSTWESVQVPASTRSYNLEGLWCGSRYQIYASAYNKIGTGESSEILNTRTKGKKPEIPEVHRFVEVSSVSINLHLKAWQDGGCPMNYFVVEYKPRHQTEWIMADNQVSPTGNYGIMELTPATWYNLRISAHNNAGSSVAEYEVATLTLTGATLPPTVSDSRVTWLPDWWPKWLDLNVLVPVIATIVVIIVGIVVICVAVTRRKNGIENLRLREEVYQQYQYNASMPPPSTMDKRHPGFREELGYIPPPNRKLPPVPGSQYNTCDRIKRGGGSGRGTHATWDPRRPMYEELSLHPPPGRRIPLGGPPQPLGSQDTLRSGGDDEICPYATFHLLGFREEMDPQQAGNNFQTFPHQNGHGSQQHFVNSPASRSMPRHGSGNYYSCVSGDYTCGHTPNEGHQPRHGSGNYYSCVAGEYGPGGPPSSTYYSTVPGDMTASRMSNSTFSPTYDDPARSDEESDQYGGSTYSGGGPYARAIDSVSQSGTAKRLNGAHPPGAPVSGPQPSNHRFISNRGSTSGSAGQGSPEPPPPPPPRNGDLPLDSSGLGSSLNDSNNSTASNQFSEAECDHDLVQRNYGVKATKSTEEMRKLLDKNEAAAHIQNGGLRMVSDEMNV